VAGQQPVKDDARGIEITPAINFAAGQPFRRHIRRWTEHKSIGRRLIGLRYACHTEVQHFNAAVFGHHHTSGRQVPMHHSDSVRMPERAQHLSHQMRRAFGWQRTAPL